MSRDWPIRRLATPAVLALATLAAAACSSDETPTTPTPPGATVTFVYESIIPPDVPFDPMALGCTRSILPFRPHLMPEWLGFRVIDLNLVADEPPTYSTTLFNVPVDVPHVVVAIDPAMCNVDSSTVGSVTERVFANGVLLTEVVPAVGQRNGLRFTVSNTGAVLPGNAPVEGAEP